MAQLYLVSRPDGVKSKPVPRDSVLAMYSAGKLQDVWLISHDYVTNQQTVGEFIGEAEFLNGLKKLKKNQPELQPRSGHPAAKPKTKPPANDQKKARQSPDPPEKPSASKPTEPGPTVSPEDFAKAFATGGKPKWIYQIGDERYGPVTMVELREIAARGGIKKMDLVWEPSMPRAIPAEQIAGLFHSENIDIAANSPSAFTVPLLVSAISNGLFGVCWCLMIWGIIIGIPMLILCYYELSLYGKIGTKSVKDVAHSVQRLTTAQIILGVFLNLPTLMCGIILSLNAKKYGA
jgi:hypothetical protein